MHMRKKTKQYFPQAVDIVRPDMMTDDCDDDFKQTCVRGVRGWRNSTDDVKDAKKKIWRFLWCKVRFRREIMGGGI